MHLTVFVGVLFFQDGESHRGEFEEKRSVGKLSQTASEDSDVFGM